MKTQLTNIAAGLLATLLVAAPAAAAPPNPHGGLYWLAGEIRGQIIEVEARAKLVLPFCDDAEDVHEELEKLARDLTRFEQRLAQGVRDGNDLDRLGRLAEKVHEHACELKEELEDALEDVRFGVRDRRFRRVNHVKPVPTGEPTHFIDFDLDDLEDELEDRREERREAIEDYYDDLEDRFDDFDDDDFRRRRFAPRSPRVIYSSPPRYYVQPPRTHYWGAQPRVYYPHAYQPRVYQPRVYQPRGVRVTVGRFGPSFSFSAGRTTAAPTVAPKAVLPPPPVATPVQQVVPVPRPVPVQQGVGLQQVQELRASVERLHQLTRQLQQVLCG